MAKPTEKELEAYLLKLKQNDDQFDTTVEFGKLLMKGNFTSQERLRYKELKDILLNKGLDKLKNNE